MPETQQRFSLISDKTLADLRKLINVPIEDSLEPWCYEASARISAIAHRGLATTIPCGAIRLTPPGPHTAMCLRRPRLSFR